MKLLFTSMIMILSLIIQPVQADIKSDSEQIMNDAEKVFSQFFPTEQETKLFPPYLYRFYPSTGIYLGINQENEGVYVLGGNFGNTPFYVGQKNTVIALLNSKMPSASNICDTKGITDIFNFEQKGDTTSITTNGQCPVLTKEYINACIPSAETDTNGNAIATDIHTLSQVTVNSFSINSFSFSQLNTIAEKVATQKACFINAPMNLPNNTIESDICQDITKLIDDLPNAMSQVGNVIPGVASQVENIIPSLSTQIRNVLPGLTAQIRNIFSGKITASSQATSTFVQVDDCFKTDASFVLDLQSRKIWKNQSGSFVQIN